MAKCRIGTAKIFCTSIASLSHISKGAGICQRQEDDVPRQSRRVQFSSQAAQCLGPHIFAPMDPACDNQCSAPCGAAQADCIQRRSIRYRERYVFPLTRQKCCPTKKSYGHLRSLGVKYHNGLQQPPGVLILGLADAADGQIFSYTALIKEQHIVTEISDRGQVVVINT